ncbi:helix-turn-helix transcriptional regulator [Nonomuraea sp. MG754425]|uniref:ArsR/SmtB family transcription factor n=1 Tax=Nonomuraea sp. MG754425 TaxID=2570319 RepID=UPI001F31F671|nr:winged helix-turn-helix domain-containing protein [Nonomuraea sp. MG754425]
MGLLRIHFTADDLARTTIAATADPLWELLLSRFRLHDRDKSLTLRPWIHRLHENRALLARAEPGIRWLSALAPAAPYFPDFLTPAAARDGLGPGLAALRSTPRARLAHELRRFARHAPVPDWAVPLARGDDATIAQVTAALNAYHEVAIAPHQQLIQAALDAERAKRVRHLLDGGVEELLASMRPLMRWRSPVLEVDYSVDRDLHLDGRGLRLVPSFFCRRVPVAPADPELPPTLIYPLAPEFRWKPAEHAPAPLKALIGGTRAAVLHAIDVGATTTELARRTGISPAAASRHTTVLREAGLISSQRHGPAVLHVLTALGRDVLQHG